MRYVTDLHIHSKYAGACSSNLILPTMAKTAETKGIGIMGTGDFTHPLWIKDIKDNLVQKDNGLFTLKGSETQFVLSSEVCTVSNDKGTSISIFSKDKDTKKIHNCLLAPNIEVVEQINEMLLKHGSNLAMDGRPSVLMRAPAFVEELMKIDKRIFIFPAHAWTPWFGVFGSISGFDSIKEAYEDQAKHIHAIETGLSSDPAMNWRISSLDKYAIISGSDAHSPQKLAREAIVLNMDEKKLSYDEIINRIKSKNMESTVEFYPEEGKYHYDGHRKCNVSFSPEQAKKFNDICPVCRKKLILGVMHRIDELADREEGYRPKDAVPFVHAIPLLEVLSYVLDVGPGTKKVAGVYSKLIDAFGTELNVLLDADIGKIGQVDSETAKAIKNIRDEKVQIKPGYDGVFGVLDLLGREKVESKQSQSSMSDFS